MLTDKLPKLDLHGEQTSIVKFLVDGFVSDKQKEGYEKIVVIHGKSTNILTREVHQVLKENKKVEKFNLNNWNLGETIIYLKKL